MAGPLVVVAGSVDKTGTVYDPPIAQPAIARQAAEEIGKELARKGCRIIVYSNAPEFIETAVVRGFVAGAPKDGENLIQVRFPLGDAAAQFSHTPAQAKLFHYQADSNTDWEASFYRSLRDADGVVLVGGGQSVLATGHMALGYRIPVLALPQFGGASQRIWRTIRPGQDLHTEEEKQTIGRPTWDPSSAAECIMALLAMYVRRAEERAADGRREQADRNRRNWRAAVAIFLFLAALSALPLGLQSNVAPNLFVVLLYFSGPVAGAAGSMIRSVWSTEETSRGMLPTIALGLIAGGTTAVLFLLAQLSSGTSFTPQHPTALAFSVAIGFIAGFTFDHVYRKLADSDVVPLDLVSGKHRKRS